MQFKDAVYKIRYTIDEMQAMTGLGNKVSMQDFTIIEDKVQITHGKKKALKEPIRIGIVVFDMRLNLRCAVPSYERRSQEGFVQQEIVCVASDGKSFFGPAIWYNIQCKIIGTY